MGLFFVFDQEWFAYIPAHGLVLCLIRNGWPIYPPMVLFFMFDQEWLANIPAHGLVFLCLIRNGWPIYPPMVFFCVFDQEWLANIPTLFPSDFDRHLIVLDWADTNIVADSTDDVIIIYLTTTVHY